MLLDPGFSVPAFREIQLHKCLKYKSLREHIKSYTTYTTVAMKVKSFFTSDSGFSGFPVVLSFGRGGYMEVVHIQCL